MVYTWRVWNVGSLEALGKGMKGGVGGGRGSLKRGGCLGGIQDTYFLLGTKEGVSDH